MKRLLLMMSLAMSMLWRTADGQTVTIPSTIKGLTIMLEYKDFPFPDPVSSISDLMNKQGYNANGSLGSVRDYYYTQSNQKVTITSTVVKVTLPENASYYEGTYPGNYVDAAIERLNITHPEGFQGLTADPIDGALLHMHILVRGAGGGSTNGPVHDWYVKNNTTGTIKIVQGNIVDLGASGAPSISTICHEMGHSVMSWTDYYQTAFSNHGIFNLMGGSGTAKGPVNINPALRLQRGWIAPANITEVSGTVNGTYTITANNYSVLYRYTNPTNSKEYLVLEALKYGGYYQMYAGHFGALMPEGLAIWYVDEDGGYNTPGQEPGNQFYIRLVQADNKDEMHDEAAGEDHIGGEQADLYGPAKPTFPNNHPFRWKDGGEFGINISNINSPSATTMAFTVTARPSTVVATSDAFGTISPKGTVSVAGGSKSFSFTPAIGYELDVIKVNGVAVTKANPFVMTGISGHQNKINATFKRKSPVTALPSPWQKADIGTVNAAGFVSPSTGTFSIESYGNGLGKYSDSLTYVYQAINGDGTFIAHIADYNRPTNKSRIGIMVREDLDANSAYSAIVKYPLGGAIVEQRKTKGDEFQQNPNSKQILHFYNLHNWLKIVRVGDQITSYCSRDAVEWVLLGDQIIAFPYQVYIGFGVTGANGSYPSKAVFDNVSWAPAPLVSITSPANNAVLTTNTVTINASATPVNASRPITKVDFYSGSTLIGSDNTAPYSLVLANGTSTHILTVRAIDNTGVVSVSSKIKIEFPCVSTDPKITVGTVIGTEGAWDNVSTREKAFDGDITTYFDAPIDIAWTGLTLPSNYKITGIKYVPRAGWVGRMLNGRFQGSNTADFSAAVDLATIVVDPKEGWNCFPVFNQNTYKYVRYISAAGGIGNVAEIEFYGTASPVNILPTVTITSPQANTGVESYPAINIAADASDEDGTITKVEFYTGSTLLGTDLTAPYTYAWTNAGTGMTTLNVKATDNKGGIASSAITIIVTHANVVPTVTITSPASGASIEATPTITIAATASDTEGPVSQVDFYIGSNLVGTDLTAPYTYAWANALPGSYTLTARATDNSGGYGFHTITNVAIIAATSTIAGPACGSNNSTLSFELSAAKRTNATGYNWYYTGTSQSITVVAGTPYKATILTGTSFAAGDMCVGVNYSVSPWYTSYCKAITKCVSARKAGEEVVSEFLMESTVSPNPSSDLFHLTLAADAASVLVVNEIGHTVYQQSDLMAGDRILLGENFTSGVYLMSIRYANGNTETKRMVKLKY